MRGALVFQVFAVFQGSSASPPKPHIIHILADDFGWSNVGYHRDPVPEGAEADVLTPNIDALARGGIELDRHYVFKYCSPSRCAIQTGRNPIHVNVQNVPPEFSNDDDPIGGFQGIPVNMTGIASHLKRAGYHTHMVGKWDVGMATAAHHPRARGYDSWFGYWHHANDYWQHTESTCGVKSMRDLWRYNATYDGPAADLANGKHCKQNNQNPEGEVCVYEEKLLTDAVKSVINAHDPSEPLFLFWSMHLIHMPLEVPDAYEAKFSSIKDSFRRKSHAMGNYMDDQVGEVVDLLKAKGIWDDAVVVFHSDNGGEIMVAGICGGNNWPLRGGKFSNFEGGIRVNAFVSGGLVPQARRGAKLEGLVAGWDWYATYAGLAGVDPTDHAASAVGLPAHDSIDMWAWLSGGAEASPREEFVIGDTAATLPNGDGQTLVGGLIRGRFKLIVAPSTLQWDTLLPYTISQDVLTGPSWPNSSSHLVPLSHYRTCGRKAKHGCLFDIFADPLETTSIAEDQPQMFEDMLARIDELQTTVYSPVRGSKNGDACDAANQQYGGYWGPFASTAAVEMPALV